MYTIRIGSIHPKFFQVSDLAKRFDSVEQLTDSVAMFFKTDKIIYKNNTLHGEDKDFLKDIAGLIKDKYGPRTDRNDAYALIDFKKIPKSVNVVNVGVLNLPNNLVGWDGTINAYWYDDKPPHDVVNTYYKFWVNKNLSDYSTKDLSKLPQQEVIDNLQIMREEGLGDSVKIAQILKNYIHAESSNS